MKRPGSLQVTKETVPGSEILVPVSTVLSACVFGRLQTATSFLEFLFLMSRVKTEHTVYSKSRKEKR